jgi:hypothetical protein
VPVDAASVEDWRRSIESLYPQLRERSDFDKPLFDELMSALADYRKSHPEASAGAR